MLRTCNTLLCSSYLEENSSHLLRIASEYTRHLWLDKRHVLSKFVWCSAVHCLGICVSSQLQTSEQSQIEAWYLFVVGNEAKGGILCGVKFRTQNVQTTKAKYPASIICILNFCDYGLNISGESNHLIGLSAHCN